MYNLPKEFLLINQNNLEEAEETILHSEWVLESIKKLGYETIEKKSDNTRGYELIMECHYLRSDISDSRLYGIEKLRPMIPFTIYAALYLRNGHPSEYNENVYKQLIEKYGIASKCYYVYSHAAIDLMEERQPDILMTYAFALPRKSSYIYRCTDKNELENCIQKWEMDDLRD